MGSFPFRSFASKQRPPARKAWLDHRALARCLSTSAAVPLASAVLRSWGGTLPCVRRGLGAGMMGNPARREPGRSKPTEGSSGGFTGKRFVVLIRVSSGHHNNHDLGGSRRNAPSQSSGSYKLSMKVSRAVLPLKALGKNPSRLSLASDGCRPSWPFPGLASLL